MIVNEKVYYTDGHGITVTSHHFFVGKTSYILNGITNVNLFTLRANKIPPVILIVIGLVGVLLGTFKLLSGVAMDPVYFGGMILTANRLAFAGGVFLLVVGAIWLGILHDRYAVHISTAEGNKNAVVSPKKNYVIQITDALKEALSVIRQAP